MTPRIGQSYVRRATVLPPAPDPRRRLRRVRGVLADDEDFPGTHAGWERLAEARRAELVDDGYTAKFIEVRPAGFRRFLKEIGGSPSMNGLAAYVALLATYKR